MTLREKIVEVCKWIGVVSIVCGILTFGLWKITDNSLFPKIGIFMLTVLPFVNVAAMIIVWLAIVIGKQSVASYIKLRKQAGRAILMLGMNYPVALMLVFFGTKNLMLINIDIKNNSHSILDEVFVCDNKKYCSEKFSINKSEASFFRFYPKHEGKLILAIKLNGNTYENIFYTYDKKNPLYKNVTLELRDRKLFQYEKLNGKLSLINTYSLRSNK